VRPALTKLSYHEERALKTLPDDIEKNESALAALHQNMADPDFFKQDAAIIREQQQQLEQLQQTIDAQYTEWEDLIQKQNDLS
jgi:ATP-binding cassette subfamily F protein uup